MRSLHCSVAPVFGSVAWLLQPALFALPLIFSCSVAARAETQTLEEAWAQAYRNNPTLQAKRAELRATDEKVSQALSNWRPSLDANASEGRTYQYAPELAPFEDPTFSGNSRSYGVQLKQPLFRGFRTVKETEAAEKEVLAGRAQLESAEQQLFLDTASAFLGVLRDKAIVGMQRDYEKVLGDKLDETRSRTKGGELTVTDVRQAESRVARAHVSRYQAETTLAQDRAAYAKLVGAVPESLRAPALTLDSDATLENLFRKAQNQNPDVIAAHYAVEQAKAEIGLNKGSLLPEVDLIGNSTRSYGQDISVPGRVDSSQLLVQVTVPLYRSGTDYSKARAAEQVASQKHDELDEAERKVHEAMDNAWQAFNAAESALDADETEVVAADQALQGVREQSRVGTRNTLDVLNAEQELLDARIDQVRSLRDRNYALLQIKAATGDLTARNLKLPLKLYEPERHYDDVRNQWVGFSKSDAVYDLSTPPELEAKH